MPRVARAALRAVLAALSLTAAVEHAQAQAPIEAADPTAPEDGVEVVVTGERSLRRGRRDRTSASTVLDRRALRAPGKTSADILTDAPGIQVARRGAGSDLATATLRGATSAQTPVYVAGVRVNDDLTGTADLSLVPTFMLHSVEIYRGGAPAEADRFGLGGAVFFEPRLPRGTHAGGGATVGSFGYHQTWLGASSGSGDTAAIVAVGREAATNDYPFVDDRGTRFDTSDDAEVRRVNADYESFSAWSVARTKLDSARVTAVVHALGREQGVTGLSVIPARDARGRAQRALGAIRAEVPCDSARTCRFDLQTSVLVTRLGLLDPARELGLGTTGQHVAAERFAQRAGVAADLAPEVAIGTFVDQGFDQLRVERVEAPGARARRTSTRLAASATLKPATALELTTVAALLREETAGGQRPSDDDAGTFDGSLRGGARADLAPITLFANAGRYVRTPTLGELYGVSGSARGNPLLAPEQGVNADLGGRLDADGDDFSFAAEVWAFARFASDLIAYRRTALGATTPFNVDTARVLGAEAVGSLDLWRHVQLDLVLTALDPRDTSDGVSRDRDLLPFIARLTMVPSVRVYAERPLDAVHLSHASLGARLLHRSSRVADPAGLIVLDALTTLELDLMLLFADDKIAVRGRVENVTDDRATDVVGFPLPGRGGYASAEVWW